MYRPSVIYELKGAKIIESYNEQFQSISANEIIMPDTCTKSSDTNLHCSTPTVEKETMNKNTIFYTISFYTIMTCNYWTDQTLQ